MRAIQHLSTRVISIKPPIIVAGLVLLASAAFGLRTYAQTTASDLPRDVMDFVARRASCVEWFKKTSDQLHAPDTTAVMQPLKCNDIRFDETLLRQKYGDQPKIIAALDATWTKVVKRLPVQIHVPQDLDK